MSDRDELAKVICDACEDSESDVPYDVRAADSVIAAGWRKKPSREELLACVEHAIDEYLREDLPEDGSTESETVTDAILALLDGPTETGESK